MGTFKDLTGRQIGRLTLMYRVPEKKNDRWYWHCKCSCGNEKDIMANNLTRSKNPVQSCGCLQRERTRKANQSPDLTGKRFGRLVVEKRCEDSSKWICKCDCGNTTIVDTNHLNAGHTRSCGCLQKDRTHEACFRDLIGEKFGLLTVLGLDTEKSEPKKKYWICQCECGTIKSIRSTSLISGDTQSCGCLRISHGELKIKQLLEKNNIPFAMEQSFESCKNPKTGKLFRFDFYVNNQYLIEYNGKQHYNTEDGWDEPLEDIQYRDNYKKQWAEEHNIPLIVIPYTQYDSLTIDDLLLNK